MIGKDSSVKTLVEDYLVVLTVASLQKINGIKEVIGKVSGVKTWCLGQGKVLNMYYSIKKDGPDATLTASFVNINKIIENQVVTDSIQLISTPCHFGGKRWWFLCPCKGNRCSKLYLKGNYYFASREALRLSYNICNRSKFYRQMDRAYSILYEERNEELRRSIKYPFRNGKPTRKMRSYLKKTHYVPTNDPGVEYLKECMFYS